MPPALAAYAPNLQACERRLTAIVRAGSVSVAAPAEQTLRAGGKRLRPLLVFCSAPAERRDDPAVAAAASAVELVHMATLVHDDVLDAAELRRGLPTVVHSHGRDAAVGTGDFLFAQAFAELTTVGSVAGVHTLARASLQLSRGEIAQGRRMGDLTLGIDEYLERVRMKTAALFAAACRLGGELGGGGAATRLAEFGRLIGIAFQILDDILDLTGSSDATGKRRGADLRDGTVTLPMIHAMRLDPGLRLPIGRAMSGGDSEEVCALLREHPGTEIARHEALELVERAHAIADEPDLGGADTEALREVAEGVVDRYA